MTFLVANLVIDPSLRGLHWLEGARVHFCIKKAYIFGQRGGYSPLSPPPVSAPVDVWNMQPLSLGVIDFETFSAARTRLANWRTSLFHMREERRV